MNDAVAKVESARTWQQFVVQAVTIMILMYASLGCYLLVLKWRGPDADFITHLAIDEWLPFAPTWVWVYLLPYPLAPVIVGMLRRLTFVVFTKRCLAAMAVTLLIFIAVPTQTAARPAPPSADSVTNRLYRWMAEIDEPPANAAPSLHVSLTCLLSLAVGRDFPRWKWLALGGTALVLLATLGTRQHHVIDVVTGMALAAIVALIFEPGKALAKASG